MTEMLELRKRLKAEVIALCETQPSSREEKLGESWCEKTKVEIIAMAKKQGRRAGSECLEAWLDDACQRERCYAEERSKKRQKEQTIQEDYQNHWSSMKKLWCRSFQQIDDSSWIILNSFILKQLPLIGTEKLPNDYVDETKGFLYRVKELQDDEERPQLTTDVPTSGSVQADYSQSSGHSTEYYIGSTARLKIMSTMSPDTPREHENLAYAARKNPSFRLPQVLSHGERDGRYFILADMPGVPRHRASKSITFESDMRMRRQLIEIIAEISQWEGPSFGGVGGKQVTCGAFLNLLPEDLALNADLKPTESVALYLKKSGFDLNLCRFLNASLGPSDCLVDDDLNLVGLRNWEHCLFVPLSFITPYTLGQLAYLNRRWEFEGYHNTKNHFVDNCAAEVAVILNEKGVPADFTSFNSALKERVRWGWYREHVSSLVPKFPDDEEVAKKLRKPEPRWPDWFES